MSIISASIVNPTPIVLQQMKRYVRRGDGRGPRAKIFIDIHCRRVR